MKLNKITVSKVQDSGEVNSKRPTHNLVASDDKFENKTIVGSFWTKESQYGKFLSGDMKKSRTHEGKDYDGYVIITEKEWDEYQTLKASNTPTVEGKGIDVTEFTGAVANTQDIPF